MPKKAAQTQLIESIEKVASILASMVDSLNTLSGIDGTTKNAVSEIKTTAITSETVAETPTDVINFEVRAPKVKAPEVKAPKVKAPEVKASEVRAYEVKASEVKASEIPIMGQLREALMALLKKDAPKYGALVKNTFMSKYSASSIAEIPEDKQIEALGFMKALQDGLV